MYRLFVKSLADIFFGLLLLAITLPIMFVTSVILFFSNKGKVFFKQLRPGRDGKLFTIIKFRTMKDERDRNGNLLPDSERLTPIGRWIRKTSLDELPQLWNVVKGEMSFVGPRLLLPEYLPLYNDYQRQRHNVKPGITGWAQVNGRNAIDWNKRFEYDVFYVQNCSFVLDIKILLKTILKVFQREGISGEGMATMEHFKGNN